eukprot:TRINITY_DN34784_c0_g1_i1.p1 TRINITY_DN34784_c0_g1~~TRINITY_DN34784_c0_g1_i1.p1  ORF type:complete len:535 (+),score=57.92 TRINITY_DN34784_c0_g1_i1:72-1676(+)
MFWLASAVRKVRVVCFFAAPRIATTEFQGDFVSGTFVDLDFLLWPYRTSAIRLATSDPYFPNAVVVGDGPLDLAQGEPELVQSVAPGGLIVTEARDVLLESLLGIAAMKPYVNGSGLDPLRRVKLAVVSGEKVVLATKGPLDDNDHFALGHYGNEYGEYRWGVFSRFIQRMLKHHSDTLVRYFDDQQKLFSMQIDSVIIDMVLEYKVHNGIVKFKTRKGKLQKMKLVDFQKHLLGDLRYALGLHIERISEPLLQGKEGQKVRVIVRHALVEDYPLHPKQKPWPTWTAYFGPVDPQHLVVVAQTAREKSLMVDDDLSDFYTGKVTSSVPEKSVKVIVTSPHCADFAKALQMHKLDCQTSEVGADATSAGTPSFLYSIAAKEKLSGDLGSAAESSLKTICRKARNPWPALAVLHLEGTDRAVLEEFEGKQLHVAQSVASLTSKLYQGVDIVHVHSCVLPDAATSRLVDGGLVLVEGLDCLSSRAFKAFLIKAREIGSVAIGRRIAVIIKAGVYHADSHRTTWPQKKMKRSSSEKEL